MNKTNQRKLTIAKGIMAAVFIFLLIACVSVVTGNVEEKKINELLDLGNKYLEDMDYENAVLVFDQIITIDPKCEDAYLGKAWAQYEMGQYEEAIATLEEGMGKVDDNSQLEMFLQQIWKEMAEERQSGNVKTNTVKKELALNYIEIIRFVDTNEPEIQLEILGDEGNGDKYSWKSSDLKCADVSSTGLVTCKPVEGIAIIYAMDEYGNESEGCTVRIYASDAGMVENESEIVKIKTEEHGKEDFAVFIEEGEEEENAMIDTLGKLVYYSGDVVIPETLQFGGKDIVITGLTNKAFRWSEKMDSISIPATVKDLGIKEYNADNPFYYCANLKEIRVDEGSEFLKVEDGVLYSKDGTILYSYPAGKGDSSYTLPREVERVCSGAFLGCRNLKEILVEDGNEFYESVGGSLIDKREEKMIAYPLGNGLTSYTIPDNVKYLDTNVFYSSGLEEIYCNSLKWIQETEFEKCDKLERIWGGAESVSIYWKERKKVTVMGFGQMENLESLIISLSDKQDIREIMELKNLKRLEIETNGQPLNLEMLSGLSGLNDLRIEGLDEVGDLSWMEEMSDLRNITLIADKFSTTDLSPISTLKNLRLIRIDSHSSNKEDISDDMKRQIAEFVEENPEIDVFIWE